VKENSDTWWEEMVERNTIKEPLKESHIDKTCELPKPIELAKLAAILAPPLQGLSPGSRRESALKEAMESAMRFYVEAVCLLNELPSDLEKLIGQFGTTERESQVLKRLAAALEKTLELDPSKDGDDADEVRRFLAAQGLSIKRAENVLKNFRKSWADLPKILRVQSADSHIEGWKIKQGDRTTYRIPIYILEGMAAAKKQRSSERSKKGQRTRKKGYRSRKK
jgi:hypothetical protein